jgi:hypothetical protein
MVIPYLFAEHAARRTRAWQRLRRLPANFFAPTLKPQPTLP